MNQVITEIKAEFADEEGWPKTTPLPCDQILEWMHNDDLEVMGTLHCLLEYKNGLARVQPPLDFDTYFEFMTRYYRRCLCEYTEETWLDWQEADVGLTGAHAIVWWFVRLWTDKTVPRNALKKLKAWIEETLEVCPQTRNLLETALYDHLLQQRRFRKFFADWKDNPKLRGILPRNTT